MHGRAEEQVIKSLVGRVIPPAAILIVNPNMTAWSSRGAGDKVAGGPSDRRPGRGHGEEPQQD